MITTYAIFLMATSTFAETLTSQQDLITPSAPDAPEPLSSATVPSPYQISSAISELRQPLDGNLMSWILDAISQQSDPEQREKLNGMLEVRMKELLVGEAPLNELGGRLADGEAIRFEIEALRLGPDATAEDLRKRDEVLMRIAKIQDPQVRYDLLELLAEQERAAQGIPLVQ